MLELALSFFVPVEQQRRHRETKFSSLAVGRKNAGSAAKCWSMLRKSYQPVQLQLTALSDGQNNYPCLRENSKFRHFFYLLF